MVGLFRKRELKRAEEFDLLFCQNGNLSDWDSYRKSVWAWNDTDKHQGWLYSFNGAVFGEKVENNY